MAKTIEGDFSNRNKRKIGVPLKRNVFANDLEIKKPSRPEWLKEGLSTNRVVGLMSVNQPGENGFQVIFYPEQIEKSIQEAKEKIFTKKENTTKIGIDSYIRYWKDILYNLGLFIFINKIINSTSEEWVENEAKYLAAIEIMKELKKGKNFIDFNDPMNL